MKLRSRHETIEVIDDCFHQKIVDVENYGKINNKVVEYSYVFFNVPASCDVAYYPCYEGSKTIDPFHEKRIWFTDKRLCEKYAEMNYGWVVARTRDKHERK